MTDFIKNEVKMSMESSSKNALHLSYLLLPKTHDQKKILKWKKHQLVKKHQLEFPHDLVMKHKSYLENLPPNKSASFQYYQGPGYMIVNNYLRTGDFKFNTMNIYEEIQQLLSISPNAFKSKIGLENFSKKKAKEFEKFIKNYVKKQSNLVKKIHTTISNLKNIITQTTPKIQKPFYVYRGERMDQALSHFTCEDDADASKKKSTNYQLGQLDLKKGQIYRAEGFNSFSMAPWIAVNFSGSFVCCIYRLKIDPKSNVPYLIYPLSQVFKEFEVLLPPAEFKVVDSHIIESESSSKVTMKVYDIEFAKII